MITLKTNNLVVVEPKTQLQDYAYMHITDVLFNGEEYIAKIHYFYVKEELIGTETYYHKHDMERTTVRFTLAEANLIENSIPGGLSGNNHSERYLSLVVAGTMYQLSQTPNLYGATGWSIVPNITNGTAV